MSTRERFMKPVVHDADFGGMKSVTAIDTALPKLDWVVQGCHKLLHMVAVPGNSAS